MPIQEQLKSAIKAALAGVDCVIGWGQGPEVLRSAPLFMQDEADVELFRGGFLAVNNPALFLPEYKGKKVAVVAKGCDARSIGQLISEGLVKREEVELIGFPCEGVIDVDKVNFQIMGKADPGEVFALREKGDTLILSTPGGEICLKKAEVTADKCRRCLYPNALIADTFAGEMREAPLTEDEYTDLEAFESLPLEERFAFWEKEISRCIRCYACRNACPLCVCRDHCVAMSRDPHWLTQSDGIRDKMFFQVIHAAHLAGRCTGCGECQRACPMSIPVLMLKRALSRQVEKLFAYRAGVDPEAVPPLLSFSLDEPKIKERDW